MLVVVDLMIGPPFLFKHESIDGPTSICLINYLSTETKPIVKLP